MALELKLDGYKVQYTDKDGQEKEEFYYTDFEMWLPDEDYQPGGRCEFNEGKTIDLRDIKEVKVTEYVEMLGFADIEADKDSSIEIDGDEVKILLPSGETLEAYDNLGFDGVGVELEDETYTSDGETCIHTKDGVEEVEED